MLFQCQFLSLPSICLMQVVQARGSLFLTNKHAFSSPPRQDWDIVEKQEEALSWDERAVMIPRKLQEGLRADSARKAPSLVTRSPGGGDPAGQRKEGESFCQARLVPITPDVAMAKGPGAQIAIVLGTSGTSSFGRSSLNSNGPV